MTKLRVRTWRSLWQLKARAVAVCLTLASGVTVYAGAYNGIASLFWTRDSVFEELGFADLQLRFMPEDVANLPDLSDIAGIERIEKRLTFPGVIELANGERLTAVLTFLESPRPEIHRFHFVDGASFEPGDRQGLVIDHSLSRYHGYAVADELEVRIGERVYRGTVSGVAISPEYLVSSSNPESLIPEKGTLGIVYAAMELVSDPLGFTLVNDLLFRFEDGVDPVALKGQILERLEKLNIDQVFPPERHFSFKYIETDLNAIAIFVPTMTVILMVLGFILTLINFDRLVASERRQLGVLTALGYHRWQILRLYLEASLVLGLLGGLVGLVLSIPFQELFVRVCAESMGMPLVRTTIDPSIWLKGVCYSIAVAFASAMIPVLAVLRWSPQQIMRRADATTVGRRRSLEMVAPGFRSLPAHYRYALRNVLRQRGRSMTTLSAIALSLGVAAGYRTSAASIDATLSHRIETDRWDVAVDFMYPVFDEDYGNIASWPGVNGLEPYLRHYVQVESNGHFEDATLVGFDPDSRMRRTYLVAGREPRKKKTSEIVLSLELARELGVGIGDEVSVHVLNIPNQFRLVGLSSDVVSGFAAVTLDAAQQMCELEDKASGLYLRVSPPSEAFIDSLYQRDDVGKVLRKNQLLAQIRSALGVMFVVLDVAAGVSIFVAVLFILTTIVLSVMETEGEFATLKAIGYGRSSTAKIVLTEAFAYAVGAAVLSVPVGVLVSVYINSKLGEAWFHVDNYLFVSPFASVLVPALLLIPLGAYPGLRHLARIDLAQAMRARIID